MRRTIEESPRGLALPCVVCECRGTSGVAPAGAHWRLCEPCRRRGYEAAERVDEQVWGSGLKYPGRAERYLPPGVTYFVVPPEGGDGCRVP